MVIVPGGARSAPPRTDHAGDRVPQPHRALARANEESAQVESAIESYHTVLKLDPPDTADVHYRLARLYKENGEPKARRHILLALEEAPRYREAHRMLLALKEDMPEKKTNSAPVIRTIDKGTRSGMKEAFQISVTDQERFKELWTKHTSQRDPAPPAPTIDFEKETVLWVSAGQKNTGGYRIDILQVEQNEDEMVVKYAATSPEEGAITTQALTAPFHIAVVPTTTRKIKFQ